MVAATHNPLAIRSYYSLITAPPTRCREQSAMLDILGGLLLGALQIYAWTVGLGLAVLAAIMLVEGAVDLVRDRRPWRPSRSPMPQTHA
jgi:hypothetical protein